MPTQLQEMADDRPVAGQSLECCTCQHSYKGWLMLDLLHGRAWSVAHANTATRDG